MQKVLTCKASDLAEVCERNVQTVDFLLAIAAVQKDVVVGHQDNSNEADSSDDDEEGVEGMEVTEGSSLEALASKWSDDDD